MASPLPKPPVGNDTAEILSAIRDLGDRIERRFEKIDERLRTLETEGAEMKGRVSQLPTLYQIAGLIFAIFGAAFVLIRFAPPH